MSKTPDEFAREWYKPSDVFANIARNGHGVIPKDRFSKEFADWLCDEYRLAMAKGIEIGRREAEHQCPCSACRSSRERVEILAQKLSR
jgi:hypothetical protein